MIKLEVIVKGNKELMSELKNFGKDIGLVSEPLESSAKFMQQQAIANFVAKGSLMQSGGWKDLTDYTKRIKAKKYPGAQMMVRTSLLISSFEISNPIIGKYSGEIEVYNPVQYAKEHQSGMGRLPQRILLRFQKQQIGEITKIFDEWLGKVINKNFK